MLDFIKNYFLKTFGLLTITTVAVSEAAATIHLPNIFTDGMVLQRNTLVPIWGKATAGETINIEINGNTYTAISNDNGDWQISIGPLKSGGPYELIVKGSNTIKIKNVLVGEVWLCSGQSNMEWPIYWLPNYKEEIDKVNNTKIRQFRVQKLLSNQPKQDVLPSKWIQAIPSEINQFSGVAYFFATYLFEQLNVPIGIINASWGGTMIEPWISANAIKAFPNAAAIHQTDAYKKLPDFSPNQNFEGFTQIVQKILDSEEGFLEKWYLPDAKISWKEVPFPQPWNENELSNYDGTAWYKKTFQLDSISAKEASLSLGIIDDMDEVWLNGELIGKTSYYDIFRNYKINSSLLKKGDNTIVIRIADTGGIGGFLSKKDAIFFQIGATKIDLSGTWNFKLGIQIPSEIIKQKDPNSYPSTLNNAMIQPLKQYGIKGILWYQGESNAEWANKYTDYFKALINDWRAQWQSNLPFLYVQIAGYLKPSEEPGQSYRAEMREAQFKASDLPNVGMATAVDIGDANNIHPLNKKEVGRRLSLLARKIAYNNDLVASGPVFESMTIKDETIHVKFTSLGGGLVCRNKYGYVNGFQIAGANQKFYWAKATIEGDRVIVSSENVKKPVAVRYAWADNPDDVNLFNFENLPAIPFRTDNWSVLTTNKK